LYVILLVCILLEIYFNAMLSKRRYVEYLLLYFRNANVSRSMPSFHHDSPVRGKDKEETTPESGLSEIVMNPPEPMGRDKK